MKDKRKVILIILISLLIGLVIGVSLIFITKTDLLKTNKYNNNIINQETTTTTSIETTTITIEKNLIREGYEELKLDEVDYTKEFTPYNINMNLPYYNDIKLIKQDKEFKYGHDEYLKNGIILENNSLKIYSEFGDELIVNIEDYKQILYHAKLLNGDTIGLYLIVYTNHNIVDLYDIETGYGSINKRTIKLDSPDEKIYSANLENFYFKDTNGDYYNIFDNSIVYKNELLKNVLWHTNNILINKDKEVYYKGKKIEGLTPLAVVNDIALDTSFGGIISSDNYFYSFHYENIEKKKIQKIFVEYFKERTSNRVDIIFEDGSYIESIYEIDKFNYFRN